jgi:hypothetical protein
VCVWLCPFCGVGPDPEVVPCVPQTDDQGNMVWVGVYLALKVMVSTS